MSLTVLCVTHILRGSLNGHRLLSSQHVNMTIKKAIDGRSRKCYTTMEERRQSEYNMAYRIAAERRTLIV